MAVDQALQREKQRLAEARKERLREILKERRRGGSGGGVPRLVTIQQAQQSLRQRQAQEKERAEAKAIEEKRIAESKAKAQAIEQQNIKSRLAREKFIRDRARQKAEAQQRQLIQIRQRREREQGTIIPPRKIITSTRTTTTQTSTPRQNLLNLLENARVSPEQKSQSIKEQSRINIFSIETWREFGKALKDSKSNKDRKLGRKILEQPLLFSSQFIGRTGELKDVPAGLVTLLRNPSNIKQIPGNIKADIGDTIQLLKTNPSAGLGKIGGDIFTFKIIGGSLRLTGKVATPLATRISPGFRGVKKGIIKVPSGQKGKGFLDIKVVSPGLGKIKTTIKKQLALEGKRIPVVTSAQADQLVSLIKRKRIVKKPIPNEANLKPLTKKLLKRFDQGRITKKQIIILDKRIKLETKGAGSLLERSFFVDPSGKVRISRLGIKEQPPATIKQILKGEFTFKTQKPQILIFEDIKVQAFPKTKTFKSIKNKLRNNKPLSKLESNALVLFQSKKSTKFKPLGAISKEPELTLSPGSIIKRKKKIGTTLINGRRVSIIRAEVVKAKPGTKKLLKKAKQGKITKKELKILTRNLKRETGFKNPTFSRSIKSKPRVSLRRLGGRAIIRAGKRRGVKLRTTARPGARPKRRKPTRPRTPRRPGRKPTPRTTARPGARPKKVTRAGKPRPGARRKIGKPIIEKILPIAKGTKGKKQKKKKKKQQSYNVSARPLKKPGQKKEQKLIKINKRPLTKKEAKRLGSTITDNTLARTFKIRKTRGKPKKSKFKTQSFNKKIFRDFRIVKGKKKKLKNTWIERKGKALIDTPGEKRGLTLRQGIKKLTLKKPIKKRKVRVRKTTRRKQISTTIKTKSPQRSPLRAKKRKVTFKQGSKTKRKVSQEVLNNLARGRAIRLRNLRK